MPHTAPVHSVPLLAVWRGGHLDAIHRGALVVVENERTVLVRGDPDWVAFYRSTSKPLQALVGLTSGAVDAFGITEAELALAAGSHSGLPLHIETARSLLRRGGIDEGALRCGGHFAYHEPTGRRQRDETDKPIPIWSNCSGQHALLLATARHVGAPLETYTEISHPVQAETLRHVARFGDVEPADVRVAIDGCSIPTFGISLGAMALSLARLASPESLPADLAVAARRVGAAMQAHPFMVGGPGRFDTDLMETAATPLLAKAGAEGLHGVAVPGRGLGLAVKVEDGHDRGYRLVVLEVLRRLGVLSDGEAAALAERLCDPVLRDRRGEPVGRLEVLLD